MTKGEIILNNTKAIVELIELNSFYELYEITISYNGKDECFKYYNPSGYKKPTKEMLLGSIIQNYYITIEDCKNCFNYQAKKVYSEIEKKFRTLLNIYTLEEINFIEKKLWMNEC